MFLSYDIIGSKKAELQSAQQCHPNCRDGECCTFHLKFKTPHHTHSSLPYCTLLLSGLLATLQYEETSFSTPEYENVQFAPPANEVEEIYGQLAERKCIEIPRQSVR